LALVGHEEGWLVSEIFAPRRRAVLSDIVSHVGNKTSHTGFDRCFALRRKRLRIVSRLVMQSAPDEWSHDYKQNPNVKVSMAH
jgi:hypothetical protein